MVLTYGLLSRIQIIGLLANTIATLPIMDHLPKILIKIRSLFLNTLKNSPRNLKKRFPLQQDMPNINQRIKFMILNILKILIILKIKFPHLIMNRVQLIDPFDNFLLLRFEMIAYNLAMIQRMVVRA